MERNTLLAAEDDFQTDKREKQEDKASGLAESYSKAGTYIAQAEKEKPR